MAITSFTLRRPDIFPDGSLVLIYPASARPESSTVAPSGSPITQVTINGPTEVSGLTDDTAYLAWLSPDANLVFRTRQIATATGTFEIDLTDYVTDDELDDELQQFVTFDDIAPKNLPTITGTLSDDASTRDVLQQLLAALDGKNIINNLASDAPLGSIEAPTIVGTPAGDPNDGNAGLVSLSWTAVANAQLYAVQEASSGAGPWTTLAAGLTATSYTASIPVGQDRWYRIVASRGTQSVTSNAVGPAHVDAPAAPTTIAAPAWSGSGSPPGVLATGAVTGGTTAFALLKWLPTTELVTLYRVQSSADGSTGWTDVGTTDGATTQLQDISLPFTTDRFYRVRGENGAVIGAWSTAIGPVNVAIVVDDGTSYEAMWGSPDDAAHVAIPGQAGRAGTPAYSDIEATALAALRQNFSTTGLRPSMDPNQGMPAIFGAPSAAGTFDGVTWSDYRLISTSGAYLGSLSGQATMLASPLVDYQHDVSDHGLILYQPANSTWGGQTGIYAWQVVSIDHTNKTITATGISPFFYGNVGPGSSTTPGALGSTVKQAGNLPGLGWGRGWAGLIRRGDVLRGRIPHSLLLSAKDGWVSGGDYWQPAYRSENRTSSSGATAGGALRLGMCFQLNPAVWTDAKIRAQTVYTGAGGAQDASSNTLHDRGPGTGNSEAWPAAGGPDITHRELLQMVMYAARDYGLYVVGGIGSSVGLAMEGMSTARWTEIIQGGETGGAGQGFGGVLRGPETFSAASATQGFPWWKPSSGADNLRVLAGGQSVAPKGAVASQGFAALQISRAGAAVYLLNELGS